MKRTLRLVGVAAMVLLLAASCKKDEKNNGETQRMTFTAGIEQGNSKTGLTPNGSHAFNQVWSEGDAIKVNGTTFGLKNGAYTDCAEFDGEVIPAETYYAVYPATAALSNSTATFTLPASQDYVAGSYQSNLAPMAAKSTDENLSFTNLCGLMELGLVGENITVTSLELSCDKPICGTATYNIDDSEPLAMADEPGEPVTMNCVTTACPNGVALNGTTPTSFIFVLPPVENGAFSLKVSYTAGANAIQMTKSLGNITIGASQVAYNTTSYELVGVNGTVTTGEATDVTSSGASVPYTVSPNGVSQARQHGVCYGTSQNPSISGSHTEATGSTYTASLTGLNASTTYYVRAYAIFEPAAKNEGDVVVYGGQQSFETEAGSSAPQGFVDFGTHVGGKGGTEPLYWAKCNVGASSETQRGSIFMWGGVDDCAVPGHFLTTGDWKFCPYTAGTDACDADHFTKYCNWAAKGDGGYTDSYTSLLAADDAATCSNSLNRTPSKAEWEELISVAYRKNVIDGNGKVTGFYFYIPKDDSHKGKMNTYNSSYSDSDPHIFLPAGWKKYDLVSTGVNYWSNTLCTKTGVTDEYCAQAYYFAGSSGTVTWGGRFWGFCVRPVREQNP